MLEIIKNGKVIMSANDTGSPAMSWLFWKKWMDNNGIEYQDCHYNSEMFTFEELKGEIGFEFETSESPADPDKEILPRSMRL